jgi:hypothetical protein
LPLKSSESRTKRQQRGACRATASLSLGLTADGFCQQAVGAVQANQAGLQEIIGQSAGQKIELAQVCWQPGEMIFTHPAGGERQQ